MERFHPATDKRKAMTEVVSYHGVVPLERGLCYCLYLVGKHFDRDLDGALISASRTPGDIAAHNREFGTNLHSQPWLIKMHELHPKDYARANSTTTSSHTLHSDGSNVYRDYRGHQVPPGGVLNWYQRGLDFDSNALAAWFVDHAADIGLHFTLPYKTGSELHHAVGTASPINVLQSRNVIAKR